MRGHPRALIPLIQDFPFAGMAHCTDYACRSRARRSAQNTLIFFMSRLCTPPRPVPLTGCPCPARPSMAAAFPRGFVRACRIVLVFRCKIRLHVRRAAPGSKRSAIIESMGRAFS